jgi:hypothetical protein
MISAIAHPFRSGNINYRPFYCEIIIYPNNGYRHSCGSCQPIKYKKNKIMSTKNIITTITELRVPEILKSKKSR